MESISENRSITLARIEFDTLTRVLRFEADARATESARLRGKRRSSLLAIADSKSSVDRDPASRMARAVTSSYSSSTVARSASGHAFVPYASN